MLERCDCCGAIGGRQKNDERTDLCGGSVYESGTAGTSVEALAVAAGIHRNKWNPTKPELDGTRLVGNAGK